MSFKDTLSFGTPKAVVGRSNRLFPKPDFCIQQSFLKRITKALIWFRLILLAGMVYLRTVELTCYKSGEI